MYVRCPPEYKRGCVPGPRVTDDCALPYGYWELNLGQSETAVSILNY